MEHVHRATTGPAQRCVQQLKDGQECVAGGALCTERSTLERLLPNPPPFAEMLTGEGTRARPVSYGASGQVSEGAVSFMASAAMKADPVHVPVGQSQPLLYGAPSAPLVVHES
jgi:hypothetical protein